MCAEYTLGPQPDLESLLRGLGVMVEIIRERQIFHDSHRFFPRAQAPILVRNDSKCVELVLAEFSLIPSWWNPTKAAKKTKNNRPLFATHNARIETINEKPTFRDSFQKKHCVVPIGAFYESSIFGNRFAGNRICLTPKRIEGQCLPLLAAGCYSEWTDKGTGENILSFTIITSIPSREILSCGHDRMPVFLEASFALDWLGNEGQRSENLKSFLLNGNLREKLSLDVTIDRPLKEGWIKNAPSELELLELKKQVG